MEQELEKDLKVNTKLILINIAKVAMKSYRTKLFSFFKFIKIIYKYKKMGG
jgi:hypothetical protein